MKYTLTRSDDAVLLLFEFHKKSRADYVTLSLLFSFMLEDLFTDMTLDFLLALGVQSVRNIRLLLRRGLFISAASAHFIFVVDFGDSVNASL